MRAVRRRARIVGTVVAGALVLVLGPAPAGAGGSTAGLRPRWSWPLQPPPTLVRGFAPPASPYGAGHRGVDLSATVGAAVHAVADGTVTHVGVINGRGTISVLHADGVRSTLEPVRATARTGDVVAAGAVIGEVEPVAGHCAPATCLHLGAIRDRTYLDPMARLTIPRVILLPPV